MEPEEEIEIENGNSVKYTVTVLDEADNITTTGQKLQAVCKVSLIYSVLNMVALLDNH